MITTIESFLKFCGEIWLSQKDMPNGLYVELSNCSPHSKYFHIKKAHSNLIFVHIEKETIFFFN